MRKPHRRTERIADVGNDVLIELRSQPSRTALLLSAVALSIGALVASLGITANAAHQIDADLAAATNRTIKMEFSEPVMLRLSRLDQDQAALSVPGSSGGSGAANEPSEPGASGAPETSAGYSLRITQHYPPDTLARIAALDSVRYAGMILKLSDACGDPVVSRPATGFHSERTSVSAATAQYLAAAQVKTTGPVSLLDSELPVAFLGANLAKDLGIPRTADLTGVSLEINQELFSIAGFLDTDTELATEVIIPYRVGLRLAGSDVSARILVYTEIGAGAPVARVLRHTVLPNEPQSLVTSLVVSAQSERDTVSVQMSRQMVWIGLFLIMLTMLLIANSMVVSVTSRTTEIGIRRALGSSRAAVATVFLMEGLLLGFLGGLAGSALSAVVVVGVSFLSGWSAFLNLWWIAAGPFIGLSVGLVASAYPAWRAARVQPAIAVRSN